jgi:hypothetical protein
MKQIQDLKQILSSFPGIQANGIVPPTENEDFSEHEEIT